jgi:uncharacterized membrane protein
MMFLWLPLLFLIPLAIFWDHPTASERVPGALHGAPSAPTENPNEIVRKRLARGEITIAEFEEIRGVISN